MKKVLVIRFSSIGDIVLTTPVIRALKQQGGFEVHTLVKKQYAPIYRANSHVDKVHVFDKNLPGIIETLQKEGYYYVVDLQKNLRSWRIRWMLQKPDASFDKLNFKKWLLVRFKIDKLPQIHIVDRYFQAVKELGVSNDGKGLDFFIPSGEIIKPEKLDSRLKNGFAAFVIGGQHNTKIFPPEKIAEVINLSSVPSVLLGGKEDEPRTEKVLTLCPQKTVINTCGKLSLFGSASLVKAAQVVVSNDTGLMHIAAAFNKPVISIWGNTVPQFGMTPYEPQSPENVYISEVKGLPCRPCSKLGKKSCPKKHFDCMVKQNSKVIASKIQFFMEKSL